MTQVVAPVVQAAAPLVQAVAAPVIQVAAPVVQALAPVTQAVAPVLGAAAPVTQVVQAAAAPLVQLPAPVAQAARLLTPVTSVAPTTSATSSSSTTSSAQSRLPAAPVPSSLDQRQAATAATFAQPLAAPVTGFAAQHSTNDGPATAFSPSPALNTLSSSPAPWMSPALLGSITDGAFADATDRVAPAAASRSSAVGGGAPGIPSAPPCSSGAGASGPGGSAGSGSSRRPARGRARLLARRKDFSPTA